MQTVTSRDGTPIAFDQVGSGAALLLVHGTGSDHSRWGLVLPELAKHFTVGAMDRRGRGGSGDAAAYTIESEYEDIAAVANALAAQTGGPVDVLGHSYGAACVLGAAGSIPHLRRLILYEPPMLSEQHSPQRTELLARMDQALANGEREAVVILMMCEMLGIPAAAIDRLRGTPAWADSVAAAHTIPRELRVSAAYGSVSAGFGQIAAPALFLLGSESPAHFKLTSERLCALLPDTRLVVLPGQQHSAMLTAPALFSQEVVRFLKE